MAKVRHFRGRVFSAMCEGIQLTLGVARQVRALGQVLAQQAIGVLVGAALPRAVRIGKEDLDRKPLGQRLVLGPLVPSIIGQGFPQQGGHEPQFFREPEAGTSRIRSLHSCQKDQTRCPLHQCSDGRAIAGSLDEVAFPVAWHRAGRDFDWTLGHRRHVGDLSPSIRPPCSRPARLARLTQCGQQCAPQRATRQHVEPCIDRLDRVVPPHVVRIRAFEPPSNLFGRAALN